MTHGHEAANVRCDEELSGKYTDFIQSHIESLKEKCVQLTACIDSLLKDESPLLVLQGGNVSLNKTCSLLDKTRTEDHIIISELCTSSERDDIRGDINSHLEEEFKEGSHWGRVKKCLRNSYGDQERGTYVEDICGLAFKDKPICSKNDIHEQVETFFNDQINHLKCTCRSLEGAADDHSLPLPIVIGASVGGLLLLIIFLAVCCICYRRHKSQKKEKRSPKVIYLPAPNSENYPVYQEVFDDRVAFQGYQPSASNRPPSLPMRYTPHPTAAPNLPPSGQEEEPAYLEPIEVGPRFRPKPPVPGQSRANPNYGFEAPPKYSERSHNELDARDKESGYFQPLPDPPQTSTSSLQNEDRGYDSLERNRSDSDYRAAGYETIDAAQPSTPDESAPTASSVPLGPVPAQRTKKDDRQIESHYFELEKEEDIKTDNSKVG